jgi:hypothetical protein
MLTHVRGWAVMASILSVFVVSEGGGAEDARVAAAGSEITIQANVLSNVHTGEKEKSLFAIAYDGTPEIKAEFEKIMIDLDPERGLDADSARKLQDQFLTRLRYEIDGPVFEELYKEAMWTTRGVKALTGRVSEVDGKKRITVRKCEEGKFAFPAKLLAPDKPLVMPDKEALVLKIDERLALRCIGVPVGTFLMGEPYYQCPHWQEDPPHLVSLT